MSESRAETVLRAFVRQHSILGKLSEHNQESLCRNNSLIIKEDGERVFGQGEKGESFYALCYGRVKVYRTSHDGAEAVVKYVAPGEVFGEVAVLKGLPYPADARSVGSSGLIPIDLKRITSLLDDPAFRLDFIAALMDKLHYLTERVYVLSSLGVEDRFFHFLLDQGEVRERYELTMSKRSLASLLGTTPETISRLFAKLKRQGTLREDGHSLIVDTGVLAARKANLSS